MYDIKEKSKCITGSISRFSNIENIDRNELENVLRFGIRAIGTLESLADAFFEPMLKAKRVLYETNDKEKIWGLLIKVVTAFEKELSQAQEMLYRFSRLMDHFNDEVAPILLKYFGQLEVVKWMQVIDSTYMVRNVSYERIESLIPKIEGFIELKFSCVEGGDLTYKIRYCINEVIKEIRLTKKELQAAKANFLKLAGLNGLIGITDNIVPLQSAAEKVKNILNEIKVLVANSRTEYALEELETFCLYNYPYILKDVILLQSQLSRANRNFRLGVDEDMQIPNRINFGILEIIEEIDKSNATREQLLSPPSGKQSNE